MSRLVQSPQGACAGWVDDYPAPTMHTKLLCLSFAAALLIAAGCGSAIDADLEKSPEQLQADAAKMDTATLEKKLEACKEEAKKLQEEGQAMKNPAMGGDMEQAGKLMEKAIKLSMVAACYEEELQKRKSK